MTIGPGHSTFIDPLNQLAAVLADAAQLLLAIKTSVAAQTDARQIELDAEHADELMRLKDDGCPNGE